MSFSTNLDSVSVSNFPATQPVSGTVTATQGGMWSVSISGSVAVTQSGAWSIGRTWNLSTATDSVSVSGSVSVSNFPAVVSITNAGPQPVYLDDQNHPYDDDGVPQVSINPNNDLATGANQLVERSLLTQIAANVPPTSVGVNNFPAPVLAPNAAAETNGQLQRIADLMEAVLLELRVLGTIVVSLNQGTPEDPERLRGDPNLVIN